MSDQQHPLLPPDATEARKVDLTRRRFAKAGIGGSAVLVTLASRPVLGATCLTPSAAGSGAQSQHTLINASCNPNDPQWWIDRAPKQPSKPDRIDLNAVWPGTSYKPGDNFHPTFKATNTFEYMDGNGTGGASYRLYEVLSRKKLGPQGQILGDIDKYTDPNGIGPWFVAGLLNASAGLYAGAIKDIGVDPSVQGIAYEYAMYGYFTPTAGQTWYQQAIKNYLKDPGSMFSSML